MNALDRAPTPRNDLAGLLGDIARLAAVVETWDETHGSAAAAYLRAVEALNGEALRRLVRALKTEPAALAAMRSAAADEVVYAVLRRHGILKPSLHERVETALDGVRPMLASHGGNVDLVGVRPPAIEVRFTGACDGCAASALTFHAGVKKAVQDACPEITEVVQVKGLRGDGGGAVDFVSPFAQHTDDRWLFAAMMSDIPEDGVAALDLDGAHILLSRQGGAVTCFANACAHLGLALDAGVVAGGIITCPHHDFRYDLSSGECLTAPEVQLQCHAVRVVGHRVEVRLST